MTAVEPKEQLVRMMEAAEKDAAGLEIDLRSSKSRLATFKEAASVSQAAPGGIVRKMQDKVRREEAAVAEIEAKIVDARARISALEEALRFFPKDGEGSELRPNSEMAKVRDILQEHGKPMSVIEILQALGAEGNENKRNSLRGSLASYARDGRVFRKEDAPETFGLIEFKVDSTAKNGSKE
jgi:hypothetical protein